MKYFGILAMFMLASSWMSPQQAAQSQSSTVPETTAEQQMQISINGLIQQLQQEKDPQQRRLLVDFRALVQSISFALAAREDEKKAAVLSYSNFAKQLEETRVDKQVEAPSSANTATSLVSKGTVPELLGLAVENGAATQTQTGTTITFRANPIGVIQALSGKGYLGSYDANLADPATKALSKLALAVSFDASRGNNGSSSTTVLTGDRQQLSAFNAHYDIVNKRDPRDPYFQKYWHRLTTTTGSNIAVAQGQILQGDLPQLRAWSKRFGDQVETAKADDIPAIVVNMFLELKNLPSDPAVARAISTFNTEYNTFLSNRADILKLVARGPLLSADYTANFAKPNTTPDWSTIKIIGETGLLAGSADLTANLAFDFYHQATAATSNRQFKDVDFSTELDVPLANPNKIGNWILAGSYKYRDYINNSLDASGGLLVPRGIMNLGQLKLSIPVKGSGVKIPISVTFANRSEFIKESDTRGNIGITFDFDTLFAGLSK